MAGRGRIEHVAVDVIGLPHRQGTVDDRAGVVLPMRLVEGGIAGYDLGFDILYK